MATIEKRGDSYRIIASAGYSIKGTQNRKRMTWTPDPGMTPKQIEKELERQSVLFEERIKKGQYIDANIRFAAYTDLWVKNYGEKHLAPKTFERYKALLVRINAALGNIRLDKLQPHHITELLNNLEEEGIRADSTFIASVDIKTLLKVRGMTQQKLAEQSKLAISTIYGACKGNSVAKDTAAAICNALELKVKDTFTEHGSNEKLSRKTVLHHYRLISAILNSAVKDDQVLLSNPTDRVRPPQCERIEAEYLDEIQATHLIELLENEPMQFKTAISLLLYSGMRRGELLGLEWPDFDFENSVVSICRTSQYIAGRGIFTKDTKTASSVRTIKLPQSSTTQLQDYKVWQMEQRLSLGDKWKDTNRLFTSWNGSPMNPDVLSGWFEDFIKRSDLPPIHLHSLRHTNATLMIAGGEDIRTVSKRLGHAQTTTTMNIYSHAIQSADAKAADTLENILKPRAKNLV